MALRRFGAAVAVAPLLLQMGCYTYRPTGGVVPAIGVRVGLQVSDAGRAMLGGAMGPEIDRVEGVLLQRDSAEYLLAVTGIRTIRGGGQAWSGEQVRIKSEFVTGVYERRLSKGRTVIASVIGAGAMAYILTQSIQGTGKLDPDAVHVDSAHALRRLP